MTPETWGDRLQRLQVEHPYMPSQTLSAFATSGLADSDIFSVGESLRQKLVDLGSGAKGTIDTIYSDPVLNKHPSAALALREYISGAVGEPPPVTGDASAAVSQHVLQLAGYAKGLKVSGTWTPDWQAASQEYNQAAQRRQLSGSKDGGFSVGDIFKALGSFNISSAGDAIIGFAKGLPSDVRTLIAGLGAGTVGTVAGIGKGIAEGNLSNAEVTQTQADIGGTLQSIGNHREITGPMFAHQYGVGYDTGNLDDPARWVGHIAGDVGTAALFADGIGAVGKVGKAVGLATHATEAADGVAAVAASAGADTAGALTEEAAHGAGGVIASSTANRLPAYAADQMGAAAATYAPEAGTMAKIADRVAGSRVFDSFPVLGRTGPWIQRAAEADSWYYRSRRLISPMYRFAAAADEGSTLGKAGLVAGQAVSEGSLYGAKVRGTAALSQLGGNDTDLSQSVQGEHVLNTVNDSIANRLDGTPLKGWLNLDTAMFALHGPTAGPGALSAHTSEDVGKIKAAFSGLLGEAGVKDVIASVTKVNWDKQVAMAGSEENAIKFWTHKVANDAATWEAERRWKDSLGAVQAGASTDDEVAAAQATLAKMDDLGSKERETFLRDAGHEILNDPAQLKQAWHDYRGQGVTSMRMRMQREITDSRIGSARIDGGQVSRAETENWLQSRLGNYVQASNTVARDIVPHLDTEGALTNVIDNKAMNLGIAAKGTYDIEDARQQIKAFENEFTTNDLAEKKIRQVGQEAYSPADPALVDAPREQQLAAMGLEAPPTGWRQDWNNRVNDVLHERFGINAPTLAHIDMQKIDLLKERAADLAARVKVDPDAAPELKEAIARLDAQGYKLVSGTDIGFAHVGASPIDDLGSRLNVVRRAAHGLGLSPDLIRNTDMSAAHIDGVRNEVQNLLDKNIIAAKPGWDADAYIGFIRQHVLGEQEPGRVQGALQKLFAGTHSSSGEYNVGQYAAKLRNTREDLDEGQIQLLARAQAEADVVRPLEMRDATRSKFIDKVGGTRSSELLGRARAIRKEVADVRERAATLEGSEATQLARRADKMEKQATALEGSAARHPSIDTTDAEAVRNSAGGAFERAAPESQQRAMAAEGITRIEDAPLMSRKEASALYGAVVKGYSKAPFAMAGLPKIEDMIRAPMGFLGQSVGQRALVGAGVGAAVGAATDPNGIADGNWGEVVGRATLGAGIGGVVAASDRLSNLPNALAQVRNNARFSLNPYFSIKRLTKINAKLALEDVTPTHDPMAVMRSQGTLDADRALHARLFPDVYTTKLQHMDEIGDQAERALKQSDVFGLSPRDFETMAIGQWHRQGFSDDEIRDKVIRVFSYGADGVEGRSALERSMNMVFFPFSFDKTLYRNMGGYLLDNAGQRILLSHSLTAYDQFNKEHGDSILSTKFWAEHAPALEEASHLNAFAHGVGLGEFGGINRPLLNLFLPQSLTPNANTMSQLGRFLPALKDFQRIWAESASQAKIIGSDVHNRTAGVDPDLTVKHTDSEGNATTLHALSDNPAQAAEDKWTQFGDASAQVRGWSDYYKQSIDYNNGLPRDQQLTFRQIQGVDPKRWGGFADQPITKKNIGLLVAKRYPAFDPAAGVTISIARKNTWDEYVRSTANQPGAYNQDLQALTTDLNTWAQKRSTNDYTAQQKAEITTDLRRRSIWYAERDPRFYKLFRTTYQGVIGPLEVIGQ